MGWGCLKRTLRQPRQGQYLGLFNGLIGAGVSAGAAVDALIGVDDVLVVTLCDDAHGASVGAGAALDAKRQ